ncbi:hypothetical protein GCM10011499_27300 [Pelagibacterium lentulum]|uniref:Uncharacterized protein n=1 Tax=Pelagibacterium lentulum TaxID=2029865 RepID=A0A916RFF2_9HYPH|nr:hypothetical protein GCM10011499_27300 [Pelagibacterium lentulum]
MGQDVRRRAPQLYLVGTGNSKIITRLRHPTPTYPVSPAGLTRGSVPQASAAKREPRVEPADEDEGGRGW